jgi:hypothetical protein
MTARETQEHMQSLGSAEAASQAARFFKTGPAQYGEADVFLTRDDPFDRPSNYAKSRVIASALTSSRGWFRWLRTMVPGSMPKPW